MTDIKSETTLSLGTCDSFIKKLEECPEDIESILRCCSTLDNHSSSTSDSEICRNLLTASVLRPNPSIIRIALTHYANDDPQLKLDCFCCYLPVFVASLQQRKDVLSVAHQCKIRDDNRQQNDTNSIVDIASGWTEDLSIRMLEKVITDRLSLAILSDALKIFVDGPSPLTELVEFLLGFTIEKDPERKEQMHRLAFVHSALMPPDECEDDENVYLLMKKSWITKACKVVVRFAFNVCDIKSDAELLIKCIERSKVQSLVIEVLEEKKSSLANIDEDEYKIQRVEQKSNLPYEKSKFHAIPSSNLKMEKDHDDSTTSDTSKSREMAENLELSAMRRLKRTSGPDGHTLGLRDSLNNCLTDMVEAANLYQKAGCFTRSNQCEKMSELIAMQIYLLPSNVNVINMNQQQASEFIIKSQRFFEAHIVAEAYSNHRAWCQALFNQVVLRGDWGYLKDFHTKIDITTSFVEEILAKLESHEIDEKTDISGSRSDIMSNAMQKILSLVPDVEYRCKKLQKYRLKEGLAKLTEDVSTRSYLKDCGCIE